MDLLDYLNIEITAVTPDLVELALTVEEKHHQPYGYLHGGMNGVLIETACSLGANQAADASSFAVGVDLQVNHLRAVRSGRLKVVASPDKIGKNLHVWQATVWLEEQKIAVGRCTLAIRPRTEKKELS